MLTAITRSVSLSLPQCELSFLDRRPIDVKLAISQHNEYCKILESFGARVIKLPPDEHLPDSVFVEDVAVVLDEIAVITNPGSQRRRNEVDSVASVIKRYRPTHRITAPGTVDGGDVMRIGHRLFVGISRRTNEDGANQLERIVTRFGYEVMKVPVTDALHLKSAASHLGGGTLLANRGWLDASRLAGFDIVDVPDAEPWAADTVLLNDMVLIPASFRATAALLRSLGFRIGQLDVSEFLKAEAGLSCLSLLFKA